ncbi:NAD(P)/FAD-dependent oxidoreductase [Aequorivita antarctica]|uniref:NAD(P)/FAD-dependent oxidoreductase n=1 Tax=Aequorivita antarctica TaxID=153266 RepID=A0A5C6Z4J5_9FLAO|nr:NAD(P)/FAD-dependent oxidoreductase [Aequorivita antarctica]TXD75017.1 NAD(P)/FAD-dependent oxidoreductase [Aequorivita antarctica]SRX72253.1 3-(3-hydroxy-phenyl)propionate/3-hydroxycinnamic acid hydroxylase [Aequorivita antarctica]
MNDITVDVLIIGAGPSGCVAASYLKNNGISSKVVEKSKFPRFVIGESLLPRCMDHFEETGLLDCLVEQKFEIKAGARFLKNDIVCNFDFGKKHTPGWDYTWQVPRADFDHTLAKEIVKKGVDVSFGHEVTSVEFDENGNSTTTIKTEEGNEYNIKAKFIIDSSGYGRVLPRLLDLEKPSTLNPNSAIYTHVKETERPAGVEGTLITFDVVKDEVWLWVIPFSNGNTSIGFVGPTEFIESFKGTNAEKLKDMLKISDYYYDRLKNQEFLFEPHIIKNYSKAVKQLYGKGYALTGNSAEFLDPVFSSGVTFATESGLKAAKLITKELNGEKVDWQEDYTKYIMKGVDVFRTYVSEWYTGNLQKIFFHRPENPVIKEQICAVLAGYVWDNSNPFVKNHNRLVKTVAKVIDMENEVAN